MSQENPHKTSDPKISSHTFLFWTLPEQLSKLQRAFPQICPELMSQVKNTKPPTARFHLTHPVLNSAGTALQVTAYISANLPWTNVPRKTQNLRPQDFISHIPVLNSARTALQVTPRIISLEYHACRNHTQPLISAKPSTMAQKNKGPESGAPALGFQQHQQLVNENLCLGLESRGLCREHFKFPWPKLYLWMKTCELKFPLGSCWILWKKCSWMKTRDPSLSLTLMLKIQLWLKPLSFTFGKALQKQKTTLIGWIPALEVFSSGPENPCVTFLEYRPKPSVG